MIGAKCKLLKKEYKEAILYFKLCVENAWLWNKMQWELEAYEQLALCHYYQSNLKRARYYQERAFFGVSEP